MGGSFPDLNKDGEVTQADILKGRGVEGFMGGGMPMKKKGYAIGGAMKKGYAIRFPFRFGQHSCGVTAFYFLFSTLTSLFLLLI